MHRLLLALVMTLGLVVPLGASNPSTDVRAATGAVAAPFTIAVIPDTRGYSQTDELAATARAQTQWVVDHQAGLNIAFTVQVGDLVESAADTDQWGRISSAFDTLDTNGIPYAVLPGDHDMDLATGDAPAYDQAFPVSRFRDATWNNQDTQFGGSLGPAPADPVDRQGKDTFDLFTAGGVDWL